MKRVLLSLIIMAAPAMVQAFRPGVVVPAAAAVVAVPSLAHAATAQHPRPARVMHSAPSARPAAPSAACLAAAAARVAAQNRGNRR